MQAVDVNKLAARRSHSQVRSQPGQPRSAALAGCLLARLRLVWGPPPRGFLRAPVHAAASGDVRKQPSAPPCCPSRHCDRPEESGRPTAVYSMSSYTPRPDAPSEGCARGTSGHHAFP